MEEILHHPGVIWDVYTLQIYFFLLYIPEHMRVYMSTYRYTSEYTDIHMHHVYTYCTLTDKRRYILYIHRDKHRYIHRYIHTYRQTYIRTDIQTDRQTDRHTTKAKTFPNLQYVYYWYHRKSLEYNRNEFVATTFLIIHSH